MLFVKKLDPRATLPTCAHPGEDLAYDLYALDDTTLLPHVINKICTGIAAEHRHAELTNTGYKHVSSGLLIRDRSSMAARGNTIVGGVIDAGYRGEIIVLMMDRAVGIQKIMAGDKIAQMIPIPVLTAEGVMEIEAFTEEVTMRGTNGFGSTGR